MSTRISRTRAGDTDTLYLNPSPLAGEVREGGRAVPSKIRADHSPATSPKRQHHPPPGNAAALPTSPARGEGARPDISIIATLLPSRERKGPIAQQWESEGARAELATVAPRRQPPPPPLADATGPAPPPA